MMQHRRSAALVLVLVEVSAAMLIAPVPAPTTAPRALSPRLSIEDDIPSDDSSDDDFLQQPFMPSQQAAAPQQAGSLKSELLGLAAACNRGEVATTEELAKGRMLISSLEQLNPTVEPTLAPEIKGTWELVFSDTQLFRSSPFFMAGRAVCAEGKEAEQYDWFCDMHRTALAISTIGKVRQVISETKLVSEFEVRAGAVPFVSDFVPLAYSGGLPLSIEGSIVSTADIVANLGTAYRLLMDTVEVKGSNLPGLRQALDAGLRLPTRQLGSAIETVNPSYANPQPLFETTYLDADLRISRDQDGKAFVYFKQSDATEGTDYSNAASDLGISALFQGVA